MIENIARKSKIDARYIGPYKVQTISESGTMTMVDETGAHAGAHGPRVPGTGDPIAVVQ